MKQYIKPSFECVELRAEERFAGASCYQEDGACHDKYGNITKYWVQPHA